MTGACSIRSNSARHSIVKPSVPGLLLLLLVLPVAAADWETRKESDGISVATRTVAGSKHKAVRAEMIITSPLGELVALVQDTDACPELSSLCRESRILEQRSETEFLVYSYNDIPWPVKDRDAITRVVWHQDPDSLAVHMEASVVMSDLPMTRAVRIQQAVTSWDFLPLPDGRVRVISKAHVDPGGPTPAWLTNMLLVSQPHATMVSVRDLLASGRYAGARFTFLQEPSANQSAELSAD